MHKMRKINNVTISFDFNGVDVDIIKKDSVYKDHEVQYDVFIGTGTYKEFLFGLFDENFDDVVDIVEANLEGQYAPLVQELLQDKLFDD